MTATQAWASRFAPVPGVTPQAYVRRILELDLTPRMRDIFLSALEEDGDLDRACVRLGLTRTALRKELAHLRAQLVSEGLAVRAGAGTGGTK